MSNNANTDRPLPVSLRPPAERHAHVVQRLLERGGITWDVARVAALEAKIKFVRGQVNLGKIVPLILPTKFAEEKSGQVHHYKCFIAGEQHTFVWSQIARGLISYVGKGIIMSPPDAPVAQKPETPPVAP